MFSAVASADGDYSLQQGTSGEDAAGSLRTIGAYPGENGRQGHSVTVLSDGSAVVYGAIPNGATENGGAVILDPKRRISQARFEMPGAVRWDAGLHAWRDIGRPPECQHTSFQHTATLLSDSRILYAGGICDAPRLVNDVSPYPPAFNKLSLWNDASQQWEAAPSLIEGRLYHTATLLADGSVLFVGGESDTRISEEADPVLGSVELFRAGTDSQSADIVQLPQLHYARARHTATLLADGRVLVAGGMNKDRKPIASVEIWDPNLQTWLEGLPLGTPRFNHSATLLSDGRLMVAGGIDQYGKATTSVEIWDASKPSWSDEAPLVLPLRSHFATALSNGDVLVVGTGLDGYKHTISRIMLWRKSTAQWAPAGMLRPDGLADIRDDETYLLSPTKDGGAFVFGKRVIMLWAPSTSGTVEYLPSSEREGYATALLKDGRVLLAGGRVGDTPYDLAEIYDPVSNRFTLTGRMNQPRFTGMPFGASLSSVVMNDGKVVIAGGWVKKLNGSGEAISNYAEVWDPETGRWSIVKGLIFDARDRVYLGRLDDGRVLFFASRELGEVPGPAEYRAWIWNPGANTVIPRQVGATARVKAAIAILRDGRVLIVGGSDSEFVPEYRCPETRSGRPMMGDQTDGEEGDGCHDEPAYWQAHANATAEVWDSQTGKVSAIGYPSNWSSDSPQTLVLKNGNVVLVNGVTPRPFGNESSQPEWLWNARDARWSALPPLRTDLNWPMTELSDGSIIAWAPGNVNPAHASLLKPDAQTWEPVLRFPQSRATVVQLASGQLLALSPSEPYVAVFDRNLQQWSLRLRHLIETSQPALVGLSDGRIAVLGTILGQKKIAQILDPQSNTWAATGKLQDGRTTGKAVLLPSGKVLHVGYGELGSYTCELWQPDDDSWENCGSVKPEKDSHPKFVLDFLDDGRPVLMGSAESAFVFDESANEWVKMQVEWNQDLYSLGVAVHADKPFGRVFDPEKNEWLDAGVIAGKYYSRPNHGHTPMPAMLWDPKRRHWAYMNYGMMERNGFWLPDGCAISGPPFKIYNPIAGKVTGHPEFAAGWMSQEAMTVLADGTVVLAGGDATGAQFFYRKASCSGFAAQPDDRILMPGKTGAGIDSSTLITEANPAAPLTGWRNRTGALVEEYKWIVLAVLIPLVLYLPIRYVIARSRRRTPAPVLAGQTGPSKDSRGVGFRSRDVIYLIVVAIALPIMWNHSQSMWADINRPQADMNEPRSDITLPCRYLGIWSVSARGLTQRITLKADSGFVYEQTNTPYSTGRPVLGRWEVRGENMVWHYQTSDEPDVNQILEKGERSFTLQEKNGIHTRFELIEPIKSDSCVP